MLDIIREKLVFKFFRAQITPEETINLEVILCKKTGQYLTNPLEKIINYIAIKENLKNIAIILEVGTNDESLEELFNLLCQVYNDSVEDDMAKQLAM